MEAGGKIAVGAIATALLAWGSHAAMGETFIGSLEDKSRAALSAGAMEGIDVNFAQAPLKRFAVLSGDKTPEEKEAALAAVRALPGVSGAMWAGEGENAAAGPVATAEEVANCQADIDKTMTGKTINFKSGSTYIDPDSMKLVDTLATTLKACAGTSVAIAGHTDATGTAEVNKNLSQGRADTVAKALSEKGLEAARISAAGYGSEKLKMEGTSAQANAANRRIEFTISAAGAKPAAAEQGE